MMHRRDSTQKLLARLNFKFPIWQIFSFGGASSFFLAHCMEAPEPRNPASSPPVSKPASSNPCEHCQKAKGVVDELQACLNQVVSGYDREVKR
jgi:hypothetical protein